MSPRFLKTPPWTIGSTTQSVGLLGGIDQPVATAPAAPMSVSLQRVEPWSNTQLWPPPVSGWVGSLCSFTEVSGIHSEPAVPVNTPGDQLDAVGRAAEPTTKPPAGKVVPF